MAMILIGAIAAILLLWAAVLLAFYHPLRARWQEPVFRYPIMILESDDWGAGPLEQAEALHGIATLLESFREKSGRHPVMTLGVILEVPDTARLVQQDLKSYLPRSLEEDCFSKLRSFIQTGMETGVFVPQLHGQCHYWPQALVKAAEHDQQVKAWLTGTELPETERLPSHLQSRWVDASRLPSQPLMPDQVRNGVIEETQNFQKLFGMPPRVVVATTFVWSEVVEKAWKDCGVVVIITPGRRATCRDASGKPGCVDKFILTGDRSQSGQIYLVRDTYFEPTLGHASQRLQEGLLERTNQGRACLVEIHRFNFLQSLEASLNTLKSAITTCLDRFPDLRFMTPLELARAVQEEDSQLLERAFRKRLKVWLARLPEIPRFSRVAKLTGLAIPLHLMERLA
mgnify:CR=1 FL=1